MADENFPKINDDLASDSNDSVVVSKYPFAVRRSDFDQRDAYRFNSLDRNYNPDDDSDKDSDDDSDGSKDEEKQNADDDENDNSRKRTMGVLMRVNIDQINDLEDEEEVISNTIIENLQSEPTPEQTVSQDNECLISSKIEADLMSPVKETKSVDDLEDD